MVREIVDKNWSIVKSPSGSNDIYQDKLVMAKSMCDHLVRTRLKPKAGDDTVNSETLAKQQIQSIV